MKLTLIESIKELAWAIWVWVVSGSIGGGLMNLYSFTKTGYFKFSGFVIACMIGWFVWYITGEVTSSGALTWVSWAMSMKVFDLFSEHWNEFLKRFIEKKYWLNLDIDEKN